MTNTKTYGKRLYISPQAATKPDKVKAMVYSDIVDTLLKNGILTIQSELLPNSETLIQWVLRSAPETE